MKTVNEVSKLTGVSIRTLQYYDKIGLLRPTKYTDSGYRLYDDMALEKLQQILLFRELEFPLKEIKTILNSPDFDREKALEQQIELLTLKKEHLEKLILFARGIQRTGVKTMDFTAFDTKKIDEYAAKAKESWGNTPAYKEFEKKNENRDPQETNEIAKNLMKIFAEFGELLGEQPQSEIVQNQVKRLQNYITEHFYTCTPEIFSCLADMYAGGGEMTENIDNSCGKGTAEFAAKAIRIYCNR
ncbi:MAG: MerR family transcriptional regulator [Monoglobales bacterium]